MTISVVIATHNRASLLRATLEHLRFQRYEPGDEVIVVDNASIDQTAEVVERAAARFPVRLSRLCESAEGKTPAVNAGLAAARGDVLALTDDDVLVGMNWIRDIRQAFAGSSFDLVGGRVDPSWERSPPRWLRIEGVDEYGLMASPLALLHYGPAQSLGSRALLGANMAFRRRVLESLGGFAPEFNRRSGTLLSGEDHDFCERAVAAGFRCEYLPALRVQHWVPVERLRLRYYVRWFFASGVTQARLDGRPLLGIPPATAVAMARHFLRRMLTSPVSALGRALRGQFPEAAAAAIDGAFAAGYLRERLRNPAGTTGGNATRDLRSVPALAVTDQPRALGAKGDRRGMGEAG